MRKGIPGAVKYLETAPFLPLGAPQEYQATQHNIQTEGLKQTP